MYSILNLPRILSRTLVAAFAPALAPALAESLNLAASSAFALKSGPELGWGLSNIAVFAAALLFFLLLFKEKENVKKVREWQICFGGFALLAVNGIVFHTFEVGHTWSIILWIPQYVVFFIVAFCFFNVVISLLTKRAHLTKKEKTAGIIVTIVMFGLAEVLHVTLPDFNDAFTVFLIYGGLLILPMLYLTFFGPYRSRWMKILVASLVVVVGFQALSGLVPDLTTAAHLTSAFSLYCGYRVALEDIRLA